MALMNLEETKQFLRVDSDYEDALIERLLLSATKVCIDVARLTDTEWQGINSDAETLENYTQDELVQVRSIMKYAISYTVCYMYEHREEADHHALTLTLRSVLGSIREDRY